MASSGSRLALVCACICWSLCLSSTLISAADVKGAAARKLAGCLGAIRASAVVLPTDRATYTVASRQLFAYTDEKPAAVFYAREARDVSAAVRCARAVNVRVTPASGRHGFTNRAVQTGYLAIDLTNMTHKGVAADRNHIQLGPGNSVAMVASFLHDQGFTEKFVNMAVCTWVGMGGYLLGAGAGVLGRYTGFACDAITELQVVLADGEVVTANARQHKDLLWAACGGGGGTFGIVTSYTLKLTRLPNRGKVTYLFLRYKPGLDANLKQFMDFQKVLPTMDRRLGWFHFLGTGAAGAQLQLLGIFLGSAQEGVKLMSKYGMLNSRLDNSTAPAPGFTEAYAKYPYSGLLVRSVASLYEWHLVNAIPWTSNISNLVGYRRLPSSWDRNGYTGTPEEQAFLTRVFRGEGQHIVGGFDYGSQYFRSQAQLMGIVSEKVARATLAYMEEAHRACVNGSNTLLCHMYLVGHVFGGKYHDKAPNATAMFWRNKYFIFGANLIVPLAVPRAAVTATKKASDAFVSSFTDVLKRAGYVDNAAYVNYQAARLDNWQRQYWGGNYARLQRIKFSYDPQNVFGKPYTVQPIK